MIAPSYPFNERERQEEVEKYCLLDTLSEEQYDNITALMAHVCDMPISLITMLDKDRNFLKSHHGLPFNESPRDLSFCGHAILADEEMMVVNDATKDERFHDNPLVTEQGAHFYAGVPLVTPTGCKLGTLCVYDMQPRELTEAQSKALKGMAKQVMHLFEERWKNMQLAKMQAELKERNKSLQEFASLVSHDLKSPLNNIIGLSHLLELENKSKFDETSLEYLNYLRASTQNLKRYIDGMLSFYKNDELLKEDREHMSVHHLVHGVFELSAAADRDTVLKFASEVEMLFAPKAALEQILLNLIVNGLKYNTKPKRMIDVQVMEDDAFYRFEVSDNGDGIAEEDRSKIFEMFTTIGAKDRAGERGTGLGLSSVLKMVKYLGGEIGVKSELGVGSTFSFTVKKRPVSAMKLEAVA